jgi:uncharacterized membrane protein
MSLPASSKRLAVLDWMRGLVMVLMLVTAAVALAVRYPACAWYQRYKAAHPSGWTRYV